MLTFSTSEFDMGDVQFGTSKQHGIDVTNSGIEAVVVTCSNSSCNCTTGQMDRNPINGNSNGKFLINFNSAKAGRGTMTKNISISWLENGINHNRTFRFKVNVIN